MRRILVGVVGQRLKELRNIRLLTQADLSARSLVPLATIKDIERGVTRRPRNATLRALANALDVEPVTLLGGGSQLDPLAGEQVR